MAQEKINCWEYKKCGREPGGEKALQLGVCPAAADKSFDGINRGDHAGRFCWAVAGTFCEGLAQGTFAEKRESCLGCDFFNKVRVEEGSADLQTKFLKFISRDSDRPMLKDMTYKHITAGQRFINQGDRGDAAYIIQRGSCMVIVEKNGKLHPVGHRGEGDIVGVMSLFTGEPHIAHVEANTDMEVWVLNKEDFDNISTEDPDILSFLTELAADRLKILDFGLACPMGTEDFSSLGTLKYMAPEQINSDPQDQRTDIYALAITAYEMVVGKRPFPEDDVKVLTRMHQTRDIPDPAARVPDLPPALRKFILKAGKCDPDQRYHDILEAREIIQPLTRGPFGSPDKKADETPKETTLLMRYEDDRQSEFRQLLEEFSARARALGGELKVVDN